MKRLVMVVLALLFLVPDSAQSARIKDIAAFDGVRDNQLVGYGLIVGLNGSGDSDQTKFPVQSLANMLERMGVTVSRNDIKVKNVAAVLVTATLPPFAKQGTKLDVTVSSLGDAKTIAGGTLVMTPLRGADNQTYAVAQGAVLTNSFAFAGQSASATKNHPTAGRVPAGALVERELPNVLSGKSTMRLNLAQSDFTTASRVVAAINKQFNGAASSNDGGSVMVRTPDEYAARTVEFIAQIENLEVQQDQPARVVVNERTGTIVMGDKVTLAGVAVSHGNLSLIIKETSKVSQPKPLSKGETREVVKTDLKVKEEQKRLSLLPPANTIGEVVRGLNLLGVTPRDLISILQAIKAAGALQAELVII